MGQGRQPQDVQEVWPGAESSKHSGRAQLAKEAAIEELPGEAEGHRLTQESVAKKQEEQRARAETEARCMKQTVKQVQDKAKMNRRPKTKDDGAEARADAEEPQVEVGTAAEPKGTVASETKAADGCTLDEEGGAQALQGVRLQVLKKVASRAQEIRAMKEQIAMVRMVQEQVLQQMGVRAQAVRTVEEGMEASKRQQVRQEEEAATPQEEDSRCAVVTEEDGVEAAEQKQAAIEKTVEALGGRLAKEKDRSCPETTEEAQLGYESDEQVCKSASVGKRSQAGMQEMQLVRRQVLQRVGSRAQARRAEEDQIWLIQKNEQEPYRVVMGRWLKAGLWKEEGALPQCETNTVAENSGPETTEVSQLGDKPEEASETKAAHWCSLDEEGGAQALQGVRDQVLKKVASRAQAGRADKERQEMLQMTLRWQQRH